jgi:hypothetical protein
MEAPSQSQCGTKIKIAYKETYMSAWDRNPPAHINEHLRRPSEFREDETLIWGANGHLFVIEVASVTAEKETKREKDVEREKEAEHIKILALRILDDIFRREPSLN